MAPSEDQTDRRASQRRAVEGVSGSFLLSADARVLNLSVEGMAIETHSPLKVGRDYSLKLNHARRMIPLIGKVVWCSLVKTERNQEGDVVPVYRAGIHFENLMQGTAAELHRFIEANAVVSLEKRLFGRFRLSQTSDARVQCEAEFRVLQMSTGGMLIETDLAPPVDSLHRMEVRFPEMRFETEVRIARVAEVDRDEPLLYQIGVQFLDLDQETVERLQQFIRSEAD